MCFLFLPLIHLTVTTTRRRCPNTRFHCFNCYGQSIARYAANTPRVLQLSTTSYSPSGLIFLEQETTTVIANSINFIYQSLKNCADEIDNGLQYHLGRYAFLFESLLQNDGNTLAPLDADARTCLFLPYIVFLISSDDITMKLKITSMQQDFVVPSILSTIAAISECTCKIMLQHTPALDSAYSAGKDHGKRALWVPPLSPLSHASRTNNILLSQVQQPSQSQQHSLQSHNNNEKLPAGPNQGLQSQNSTTEPSTSPTPEKTAPTFGIDLAEQLIRDGVDLPKVMEKCCQAIEKWGLRSKGIYRLSGTHSKIQRLKEKLDRGS